MVERILVVDDEEFLRALISQVLRDEGHDVVTAESGEAALESLPLHLLRSNCHVRISS